MLTFRQFLECSDVDTTQTKGNELTSLDWHYGEAYRMYCNAVALETQNNINYRAYVPPQALSSHSAEQEEGE